LKGMLHSRFFWVMNCMTWCRSIVTSCLVFNPASRSFMVLDWPIINWVKQSILWVFFYWKTKLICHNLDVMHIENNVFENIFNMVMDVKGKTKDNIKARMNIALFCHCKNIELVYVRLRVTKPKASFSLEKNAQLLVYQWLKSLCFLDKHASNI
jgi:hypothetical protein